PFLFGCEYPYSGIRFCPYRNNPSFFWDRQGPPFCLFGVFWNYCLLQFCEVWGRGQKVYLGGQYVPPLYPAGKFYSRGLCPVPCILYLRDHLDRNGGLIGINGPICHSPTSPCQKFKEPGRTKDFCGGPGMGRGHGSTTSGLLL